MVGAGWGGVVRILVADDDEQYRALIRRTLERAGHTVVAVADGLAVMGAIDAPGLELVVLDLIMPGKEGLETIMEVRRLRPDLRVIAISGGGRGRPGDYLKAARLLGAARTLEKPFAVKALLDAVELVGGAA